MSLKPIKKDFNAKKDTYTNEASKKDQKSHLKNLMCKLV